MKIALVGDFERASLYVHATKLFAKDFANYCKKANLVTGYNRTFPIDEGAQVTLSLVAGEVQARIYASPIVDVKKVEKKEEEKTVPRTFYVKMNDGAYYWIVV